jgi:hypothetical protein
MDESETEASWPDPVRLDPDGGYWDGRAREVRLAVVTDERGSLTDIGVGDLGFPVAHAFVVRAPDRAVRGGHGHRRARQLLLALHGEVHVELRAGGRHRDVVLRECEYGLVVAPGVWSRQVYRGAPATLLVLADRPHDPDDYFTDPDDAR